MSFEFGVPTPNGETKFSVEPGSSLLFVGANGGGKTRLAVHIEDSLLARAHRISAHRSLTLNPSINKISQEKATRGLAYGNVDYEVSQRKGSRWRSQAATILLNDYDFLVQLLFAEQSNIALETHKNVHAQNHAPLKRTKFQALLDIWSRILPHRHLEVSGDDIKVSVASGAPQYPANDMSDGERAIFYLIGQTLAAAPDSLLIFDEPELHIHRSIMSRLWDELEAARPDCALVFISHDLEFVASREGEKWVLRDYDPTNGWALEKVPEDTGFSEQLATLILGSRRPILFVEGVGTSLDRAIYRACYPTWTVVPRGSCEEVIHAVVTMRANPSLTRVTCSGIVDADAYSAGEIAFFKGKGIEVLPVSEIENLFLLPSVVRAIAEDNGYTGGPLNAKAQAVLDELFAQAGLPGNYEPIVLRYCRRRIDRVLKNIDLSKAADVAALAADYTTKTASLDINALAEEVRNAITAAVAAKDAPTLLAWYDNKGLMAIACKAKDTSMNLFESWIVRALRNGNAPKMAAAIAAVLPVVTPI
ncbi:MAG: transporter ATP-binding protein [Devosia sp.]|uniref:AAA family ATPase n=1 Tax=Devosia sp. TaxID=1871048 RepID=UPI0026329726|nr:AAA family ATPase [Devosia sp.]MDB5586202.1 transporter ATP-binding protein [Devosia sp.]